jgi:hypothetical protein
MDRTGDTRTESLDWDTQALWVQDRRMYIVAGDDSSAETLTVKDQMGRSISLSRAQLEETHLPIRNATVYKPRFRPVQAYCPEETIHLELQGKTVEVIAGDALLRDRQGKITIMPRHDFNCRYQFVAAASAEAPLL